MSVSEPPPSMSRRSAARRGFSPLDAVIWNSPVADAPEYNANPGRTGVMMDAEPPVDPLVSAYLARQIRLCESKAVWGDGTSPLRIVWHLAADLPPLPFVT